MKKRDEMSISSSRIENITITSIRPNPYQPRKQFDETALEELSQSIKTYGILQPINVRRLNGKTYELVAGERRLRASKKAGLKEIPAIVVQYKEKESAIIALMENLQREDLNYIEEANGYNNLIIDHGFTQKEIASNIGKSQSTIANKLRILKLPIDIQRDLIDNGLSERHGRALLKLPDSDLKEEILKQVITNELNVSQTEDLIESILEEFRDEEENIVVEEKSRQKIKGIINTKIYLNTIKKAFNAIKDTGIKAEYKEVDKEDYVEVVVRIPKR